MYFLSHNLSIPRPSMHSFCCKVEMRCELLSYLCPFHKVRQGGSGSEIACCWFTRAPQNAEVFLPHVQKWLWVFWCWLVWCGSLFTSVCKLIKTRIQCIQNLEGVDFWPQSAFLPHTDLLFIATYYEWQILWPDSRKLSLESKGSLNTTWSALLSILWNSLLGQNAVHKWRNLYRISYPYLNLTVNCINVLRTIGLWGCVGMQGCLSTTNELCEKKWNK